MVRDSRSYVYFCSDDCSEFRSSAKQGIAPLRFVNRAPLGDERGDFSDNQTTMLRALLVALFALAAGAFFAPMAAPRAAIEARSVKIQMDIAFNFNDEALDNPASRRKAAERTASHLLAALLRPAPTLIRR